ncbi:lysosome-associated membrane glycoprotein 2 isoform X2 [Ambystoma mexicanum]|uniref:lysosome-associated membrane glycoprotein 2 isoform X2 n=1 Tax=Ambystoma mexicanum TaxID=8296 RepID=UPI0037E94976
MRTMTPSALLLPACLLLLLGVLRSKAWEVAVKDDSNRTCIYASMFMNFTIQYETNNGSFRNTTLVAPSEVEHDGSTCGNITVPPLLFVDLSRGHSWSLSFKKSEATYQGSVITLRYNTSDAVLFLDGKPNGTVIVETPAAPQLLASIPLKTKYMCNNPDTIHTENVTQIYWNVTLQAYIENGTLADNFTECVADQPTSAPASTTAVITTATPKPAPSKPSTGTYSVKSGNETCLLATMGLQLNFSQMNLPININPNTTTSTGNCGNLTANLTLTDSIIGIIEFIFLFANGRFHLGEAHITLIDKPSDFFVNKNLSSWEAKMGSSYMCVNQQTIEIAANISINVFDVRVQPFLVQNGKFSTAYECSLDDDGILIPIIVGAALAGLIIIIVIAYIIGRRKSYVGYQTL